MSSFLSSSSQPYIRFHDLLTTDADRVALEDSQILSAAELNSILHRRCCPRRPHLFAHDKRVLVPVLRAQHSRWGQFTVRIQRMDFVGDIVKYFRKLRSVALWVNTVTVAFKTSFPTCEEVSERTSERISATERASKAGVAEPANE